MNHSPLPLSSGFLAALASVPAHEWDTLFNEYSASETRLGHVVHHPLTLVAAFALPPTHGDAALCLFEIESGPSAGQLHQVALRLWQGEPPPGVRVLQRAPSATGAVAWSLAVAWADADIRLWLREALSAGASLRAEDGWEWSAIPERAAVHRAVGETSQLISGRRHDVILFEHGAVAVVYRRLTAGSQPELDVLRHLERVPGVRIAPRVLGSAIIRSPTGQKTGSAVLEDLIPSAATAKVIIAGRLRRALEGDPSLQATALDDVRAIGVITRELHSALGRPFEQGVLRGAVAASADDVEAWVARAWNSCTRAAEVLARVSPARTELAASLKLLPAKLQQFSAAAKHAPGLAHRIHGQLQLESVLMSPPRVLSIVEFDGDAELTDGERVAPQSPWRDVGRMLFSIGEAAADAAESVGGDEKAYEIAWLWEREARKAYLEGYGTGGGAMHALMAIFEVEFATQALLRSLVAGDAHTAVAEHTILRLTRTIV
jgi:predicted trehalose synthase